MKPVDPDKTEIALGNHRIDVRTVWRSISNNSEWELRLARAYWLQTVQPYTAGRGLLGIEFFVAEEAHDWLRSMADLAVHENKTEQGKKPSIPLEIFPKWERDEFQKPRELFADENLMPEVLAEIAAPLIKTTRKEMNPIEAVRAAHDLFIEAKRYIAKLPPHEQKKPNSPEECLQLAFSRVAFDEILRSNEKNSGRLPLLPPVQPRRNEGWLTMNALKAAVKNFLEKKNPTRENNPSMTQEEYERGEQDFKNLVKKFDDDRATGKPVGKVFRVGNGKVLTYQEWQKQNRDSINDFLANNEVSFRIISTMRWERFKNHWQNQQSRAKNRKPV
jgi:hypothetical protein